MERKTVLFFLFVSLISAGLVAQPSLSNVCNLMRAGDNLVKQQVEYKSPGSPGENVLWDFSRQKAVNDHYQLCYWNFSDSILVGQEHRTLYKYAEKGNSLYCYGFENQTTLISNPRGELQLFFPFGYGDKREDYFHGNGDYCGHLFITARGKVSVEADAYGILLLPSGDTLRHVLRVHHTKDIVQRMVPYALVEPWDTIFSGDSIDYHLATDSIRMQLNTYRWYADGYRYPVFETIESTTFAGQKPEVHFNTAFYYTPDDQYYDLNNDPENQAKRDAETDRLRKLNELSGAALNTGSEPENSVIQYALTNNSGSGYIRIDYQLTHSAAIQFLLTDILGRIMLQIPPKVLSEGSYTESLDISSLKHGEYILHIIVDGKKYEEKIIKY